MAGRNCYSCVYSVCEPEVWLHAMWAGEPVVPRCANHPRWPGQLREVPGVPCRNYWPRPVPPQGNNVRLIPFGDGLYAYVDSADYEELSRYTWNRDNGYAVRSEKGKRNLHAPLHRGNRRQQTFFQGSGWRACFPRVMLLAESVKCRGVGSQDLQSFFRCLSRSVRRLVGSGPELSVSGREGGVASSILRMFVSE